MTRRAAGRGPNRAGIAAAELALALPVLVLLVGGCIDFGRFSHVGLTVTNAARTGAEFGSTHTCTPATLDLWERQVKQAVADEMATLDRFDSARLTVAVARVTDGDYPRVEVDVSYPFETIGDWPGIPKQVVIRRVVAMPITRP